jgi:hypothetical protein
MNILKKISFTSLPSVIALWAMALGCYSCTTTDEPTEQTDDEYYSMSIILNTGELPQSRSLTTTYVDGTGYENYIDPEDLKILMFKNVGGQEGQSSWDTAVIPDTTCKLTVSDVHKLDDLHYMIDCTLSNIPTNADTSLNGFRIVVLANWKYRHDDANFPNYEQYFNNFANLTMASPGRYVYLRDTDTATDENGNTIRAFIPAEKNGIPMYGVTAVTKADAQKIRRSVLASTTIEVNMLRAMSKVIVKSSAGKILSNVKITTIPAYGMTTPFQMYQYTAYPTTKTLSMPGDNSKNCRLGTEGGGVTTTTDVPFQKVKVAGKDENGNDIDDDPKQSYYQIYVPETRIIKSSDSSAGNIINSQIKLQMQTTNAAGELTQQDVTIDFMDYDTLEKFDILRNTIYIFDLKVGATISYSVFDWTTKTAKPIIFDEPVRKDEGEAEGTGPSVAPPTDES